jgi:hypothetical protein
MRELAHRRRPTVDPADLLGGGLRVGTFNGQVSLPTPFSPGPCPGPILLVADVTPRASGLLLCSFNVSISTAAPDQVGMFLANVEGLTAITGGTEVAPDIFAEPTGITSTSPASLVAGPFEDSTEVISGSNITVISIAAVAIQMTSGERGAVGLVCASIANVAWDVIQATVSIIEV